MKTSLCSQIERKLFDIQNPLVNKIPKVVFTIIGKYASIRLSHSLEEFNIAWQQCWDKCWCQTLSRRNLSLTNCSIFDGYLPIDQNPLKVEIYFSLESYMYNYSIWKEYRFDISIDDKFSMGHIFKLLENQVQEISGSASAQQQCEIVNVDLNYSIDNRYIFKLHIKPSKRYVKEI